LIIDPAIMNEVFPAKLKQIISCLFAKAYRIPDGPGGID
jgi:hypothetical protein